MRFAVTRTNRQLGEDGATEARPCDNAILTPGPGFRVDARTCPTPRHFDERRLSPRPWLEHGSNHRAYRLGDGGVGIARDIAEPQSPQWVVDIEAMTDLLAFISTNGQVVISPPEDPRLLPKIEIYDGYRE